MTKLAGPTNPPDFPPVNPAPHPAKMMWPPFGEPEARRALTTRTWASLDWRGRFTPEFIA